ncbi:unnamed protein product [Hapterophycus canaliculatus]
MTSSTTRVMDNVKLVMKLARLKMTVFSAMTYATSASLANLALAEAGLTKQFDTWMFLAGWAFVFSSQMVAHFLGKTLCGVESKP